MDCQSNKYTVFGDVLILPHVSESLSREYLNTAVEIASSGFGAPISETFAEDVRHHLLDHHVVFVADQQTQEPIGFLSSHFFDIANQGVLYISGLVVKADRQRQGVGRHLVETVLADQRQQGKTVDYITGRTQNPVIALSRRRYCETVYPIDAQPTESVLQVAQGIRSHLKMSGDFDEQLLVNRNTYPGALFVDRPKTHDEYINTFFTKNVGPADSVFIIGKPKI